METCKISSTVVVVDTGEHLFKVVGHSLVLGADTCLTSDTFRVGGHDWAILYYPNGNTTIADGQFMSMFLQLVSATESDVTTSFSFCLLQDPASPATGEKNKVSFAKTFSPSITGDKKQDWGNRMFMSRDDLAASGCLHHDCLVIKCTVQISQLMEEDTHDDHKSSIIVPPSDLSMDLRNLLDKGHKADLTVKIGKLSSFNAHACLLAARSPVFREKLCGKQTSICIEDVDAEVFEALLHYIYNDRLPGYLEENTEEATSMAKDLLVAANGYGIERMKVMRESRLSRSLDVNTVSSTLVLAEQNKCGQLKDCCLKFMTADGERFRTIKKTDGFEQLIRNQPLAMLEILDTVIDKVKPKATTALDPAPTP